TAPGAHPNPRPSQGENFVTRLPAIVLAGLAAVPVAQPQQGGPGPGVALIAPAPVPRRVALADAVVVGKVVSIEEKAVSAPRFPGDMNLVDHKIAVVKV